MRPFVSMGITRSFVSAACLMVFSLASQATPITRAEADGAGLVLNTSVLGGLAAIDTKLPGNTTVRLGSISITPTVGLAATASTIGNTSANALASVSGQDVRVSNENPSTRDAGASSSVAAVNLSSDPAGSVSTSLTPGIIEKIPLVSGLNTFSLGTSTTFSASSANNTPVLSATTETGPTRNRAHGFGQVAGGEFRTQIGASTNLLGVGGLISIVQNTNLFGLNLNADVLSSSTSISYASLAPTHAANILGTTLHLDGAIYQYAYAQSTLGVGGLGSALTANGINTTSAAINLSALLSANTSANFRFGGTSNNSYSGQLAPVLDVVDDLLRILGLELVLNQQIDNTRNRNGCLSMMCSETNALRLSTTGAGLLAGVDKLDKINLAGTSTTLSLLSLDLKLGHSYAAVDGNSNGGPSPVPEPGTLALAGLALLGLGAARRRKV